MAFQLKDFASITAGMLNWMRSVTSKVTDFNQGSVARTMLEASAAELEELYLQYFIGLKEAIPTSVFNTFGFTALPANAASGLVRFSAPVTATTVQILAGTQVSAGARIYATQADAQITAGQSFADVLVSAIVPGVAGNTGAGDVTALVSPLPGVTGVTNPAPFVNGRDAETDADRKTRFQAYIASLARGTGSAVIFGARTAKLVNASGVTTEFVAYAGLVEPWLTDSAQPISLVNVYVHNGSGGTTAGLVAEAKRVIDGYYDAGVAVPGWKAAGVRVDVFAATDQAVAVTGVVTLLPETDSAAVLAAAAAAVRSYISGLTIAEPVQRSELVAIIKRDVPGVFNVTLSVPAADVAVAVSAKAVPGVITLTAA